MKLFLESNLWMLGGAGLAAVAAMFGSSVLKLAGYSPESRAERGAISFALGTAVLGSAVWLLGLSFQLRASRVVALVVLMGLAGWRFGGGFRELVGPAFQNIRAGWSALGAWERLAAAMIALSAVTTLWAAGTAQLGRDALAYHFLCPKEFVRAGGMEPVRYNVNTLQPLLAQMFYALGLLLKSEILGKFLNVGFFLLTAAAVWAFTLRLTRERVSAILAAALLLLSPGWAVQSTYAYVDTAQSFFLFCAFLALWSFTQWSRRGSLCVGAFLLGAAIAVKMLAIPAAALFAAFAALHILASKRAVSWRLSALAGGLFFLLLPSLGWYLRAYLLTGNPVFPYFNEFFTGGEWASGVRDSVGIGRGVRQFFLAPFLVFLNPEPFGGGASQLGPVWLVTAPLWLRSSIAPPDRRKLLAIVFLLYLAWFYLAQNQRFLFSALPFMAVLAGAGLGKLVGERGLPSALLRGMIAVALALQLGLILYYNGKTARYYLFSSKSAYLEAHERSYRISEWIGKNLPSNAALLVAREPELYYLDRRAAREEVWARFRPELARRPEAAHAELRREGFSHYLIRRDGSEPGTEEGRAALLVESKHARASMRLLHREDYAVEGENGSYELYEILTPAAEGRA